ncbi:hypothetical protein DW949_12880 [Megasphaera sp. AM44-1BH]|jgi:hypothetical protein|uniref:hypothetical protein n=1 Tax=Megasphaera sp. AM44-1BH TaxID=2292358 RepID=UPI000E4D8F0C|nr:hypothetical protein [Megasphaera sp. AM44-1BH]RHA08235.1 hypothetical protein DW949_12880 [Megasphaera sp. AM44-1BH]
MNIGIVDADLLGRKKHRFPNLACEKISGYYKEQGYQTELVLDFNDLYKYDKVFVSKVFTDTEMPPFLEQSDTVQFGGTGFYFDKAPKLPDCIEHHMPDYHLYDKWIEKEVRAKKLFCEKKNKKFNEQYFMQQFKEYTDYSIGFLTRGCFRKCKFCVNQKYNRVFLHSPLSEFLDTARKKICLLDDNFLGIGYKERKRMFSELLTSGKRFKFKQGLDERLLDDEICKILFSSKYDGDITFAFDNIEDYDVIHNKLKIIRQYKNRKSVKFYVLVGFGSTDALDIENAFKRIELLFHYGCLPYIMRFQNKNDTPWKISEFRSFYITLARWCNQPSIVKKMSFREFCEANQELHKNKSTLCSSMDAMRMFENKYPDIARKYFDIRFEI